MVGERTTVIGQPIFCQALEPKGPIPPARRFCHESCVGRSQQLSIWLFFPKPILGVSILAPMRDHRRNPSSRARGRTFLNLDGGMAALRDYIRGRDADDLVLVLIACIHCALGIRLVQDGGRKH